MNSWLKTIARQYLAQSTLTVIIYSEVASTIVVKAKLSKYFVVIYASKLKLMLCM